MKNNDGFYIGIDSGGTKCEVLFSDSNKKKLYIKKFNGVHYSVAGAETYSTEISKYINSSIKKTNRNLKNCIGICFGVAGAREEKDRKKLTSAFKKKLNFGKVIVTTDAMTALTGAFEDEDGIILISGTGSVLYGRSNGEVIRVGGWGRIIGDEGSGYWIGKKGMNEVAKEFDKEKIINKESRLRILLKEKMNISKENLNRKVFEKNFEIQKAAPIVLQCAESGEKNCVKIIDEAVEGLFYLVKTFIEISKRKKPIGIAYIGSIVENDNILSNKLTKKIHSELKNVKVVIKKHSSSFGAILFAEKKININ
jgi:N-acetylglucosamine kinase-like BadF-type ATPase